MGENRKLAAVVFTDIKGFTTLMSRDEPAAMKLLQNNREIQQSLTKKYNGEFLKEMGDGTLLCFHSALEAIRCAFEIQNVSMKYPHLKLRIGIHLGDILFKGGDIFGDGVNVASRIEPLAEVGGICISDQIYQLVRNQPDIQSDFLGEKSLKNVGYPVLIYAVSKRSDKHKTLQESMPQRMDAEKKSIAVLPFANMSADKEQEYFCDGISEDILNDLTCLEDLHVVSRTSSFAFKGKNKDIREIGMRLGAQTIVEGSVRKVGNRLRISAQLINVSDGYHLWSERYDREFEDVFAIQGEIASNVVEALKAKLSKKEKRTLEKIKTQDVQAYDFYIKGRSYFRQVHRDKMRLAIQLFQKATEKDKNYALAYAGLADSYSYTYQWQDGNQDILERALAASQKSLTLDPELAEAHISRGLALSNSGEFTEAEKSFETAIQLNPQLFEAFYQYGRTCRGQGKHEQAIYLFTQACHLRPDDYNSAIFLAISFSDLNREVEAKQAYQRALAVIKNHLDLDPDDTRALYLGASVLIKTGFPAEALQWIEKAVSLDPDEMVVLYNAACVYAQLGKHEEALDFFEKRIALGHAAREWIENDSDLDPIREYPRFQNALKKIT